MQLITNLFEKASYLMPSVINHKNILKPLMKPCCHKYIKYVAHKPARMRVYMHTHHHFYDRYIYKLTGFSLTFSFDTLTISKINRLADNIPLGCIDPIILVRLRIGVYMISMDVVKCAIKSILLQGQHCMASRATYILSSEMKTLL